MRLAITALCTALAAPLHAATLTTLYNFKGGAADGSNPDSLIFANNLLYGTTQIGGSPNCVVQQEVGCGTIYSFDPASQTYRILHAFDPSAYNPQTALYKRGRLYVASFGSNTGLISRVDAQTGATRVLYGFAGGKDGIGPSGVALLDKDIYYGTTAFGGGQGCGGNAGCGTIFSIDLKAKKEQVLYGFPTQADGYHPGGVVKSGNFLYGATAFGGNAGCFANAGCGVIFQYDLAGKTETSLYKFKSGADGGNPSALVIHGTTLYGTGNSTSANVIFSYDLSTKKQTVLYSFKGSKDAVAPYFLTYYHGALYGTGILGGNGGGAVFKYDIATEKESVLYGFTGGDDGDRPACVILVQGVIYGTTLGGGTGSAGTLFKLVE